MFEGLSLFCPSMAKKLLKERDFARPRQWMEIFSNNIPRYELL